MIEKPTCRLKFGAFERTIEWDDFPQLRTGIDGFENDILSACKVMLPLIQGRALFGTAGELESSAPRKLEDYLTAREKWFINQTLKYVNGDLGMAAESLGISEATLYRKLDSLGLTEWKQDRRRHNGNGSDRQTPCTVGRVRTDLEKTS
jgi:DNA-binding NtrC family response regulator